MRIISKRKLRQYYENNTQAKLPLSTWYFMMKSSKAKNISELSTQFNTADPVHGYTIFNIGGNNYRLITSIHYNTQTCYIRAIWTHAEYNKNANVEKMKLGAL